ncbi:MAG TPA: PIG-L family deacetylase [Chthonomonadaceae bacterium]|nr:PIG-L family deacetylase [Chthonomonadaceae bacterium]
MPNPLLNRVPVRTILRLVLLALALPCVYFGGASGAFFYRYRILNTSQSLSHLPLMAAPTQATRLMIFAPHCDDETLGCAGLIQQTLAAGGAVRAVLLTNGDGFPAAVAHQVRDVRVGPGDYIQFAALRQQESYRALASLGLRRKDVLFLGYPDQGLMSLWNDHWTPNQPYTSRYTRCSRSPYAVTFDPGAIYCGRDLLEDIKAALRAFRPTLVTVTHPAEDHGDHAAAPAFVMRALQELQADPHDSVWARRTQLKHYLIHRGDWPLPQGRDLTERLVPPAEMAHLDTHWTLLPLTPAQTRRKVRTIELYASQTAMMRRFLMSFARTTELYGDLPPTHLATVPDGAIRVDANVGEWEKLPPALLDPVRDNVLRDLQGGGDIRALYACRDSRTLYLRLDTRQPIAGRIAYVLYLRPFGPHGETGPAACTVTFHPSGVRTRLADGVRAAARGRTLEVAVPWKNLLRDLPGGEMRTLAVSASTTLAGVLIDRTGVRFLNL